VSPPGDGPSRPWRDADRRPTNTPPATLKHTQTARQALASGECAEGRALRSVCGRSGVRLDCEILHPEGPVGPQCAASQDRHRTVSGGLLVATPSSFRASSNASARVTSFNAVGSVRSCKRSYSTRSRARSSLNVSSSARNVLRCAIRSSRSRSIARSSKGRSRRQRSASMVVHTGRSNVAWPTPCESGDCAPVFPRERNAGSVCSSGKLANAANGAARGRIVEIATAFILAAGRATDCL